MHAQRRSSNLSGLTPLAGEELLASSAGAPRQERITVIRNYWATVLAAVTKSAWYICVILVMVLNRSMLFNLIHYWFAYLDSISNDVCSDHMCSRRIPPAANARFDIIYGGCLALLRYLHSPQSVTMHSDLKSANIMVESMGPLFS